MTTRLPGWLGWLGWLVVAGLARVKMSGVRHFGKPLTARECADYMGFTTEWIRRAITDGVTVRGVLVHLHAETLELNGRRTYRIHEREFTEFLIAIGWKHLPRPPLQSSPWPNAAASESPDASPLLPEQSA